MLSENRTPTWDGYHSLSGERAVPSVRAEGQVSVLPSVSYMKLWKCADSTEQQVTVTCSQKQCLVPDHTWYHPVWPQQMPEN